MICTTVKACNDQNTFCCIYASQSNQLQRFLLMGIPFRLIFPSSGSKSQSNTPTRVVFLPPDSPTIPIDSLRPIVILMLIRVLKDHHSLRTLFIRSNAYTHRFTRLFIRDKIRYLRSDSHQQMHKYLGIGRFLRT